jgi:O-antigen biosynthesis protein
MSPLSFSRQQARRLQHLRRVLPRVIAQHHGLSGLLASVRRVVRRDGFAGLPRALRRLEAHDWDRAPTPAIAPRPIYHDWIRQYDTLGDGDRASICAHVERMRRKPLISVLMPVHDPYPDFLDEAIDSVRNQLYPAWELCIADDASTNPDIRRVIERHRAEDARIKVEYRTVNGHICHATNSALEHASGEFVALVDHDDLLSEHALYWIAAELERHPETDILYSDSDLVDDHGHRFAPYFKSDFNLELMLGHNMVSHLGVYRRSLVESVGGMRAGLEGSQDYDLLLRTLAASKVERVRHIPAVLYHWRRSDDAPSYSATSLDRCIQAAQRAVGDFLRGRGIAADITPAPQARQFQRIAYRLSDPAPKVSVIVPTKNRADLLERCVDGLLTATDYPSLEVAIVDNGSDDPQALALLGELAKRPGVRIIPHPGAFNFAAINNHAVAETDGAVLAFLNNDIEITHSDWLRDMVSRTLQADVGAVGAKLYYPDGTIQHAGIVTGLGADRIAGHVYTEAPRDLTGSFGDLLLAREVSAVTAACMVVRRSLFVEAGGFDQANLAVSYNDVDFCLRLRERGYRNIMTPFAELIHDESASRGHDDAPEQRERLRREKAYMRRRWGDALLHDRYFSPNFSLDSAVPDFARPPRVSKPWMRPGA